MNLHSNYFYSLGTKIHSQIAVPEGRKYRGSVLILPGDGRSGLASSSWPTLFEQLVGRGYTVAGLDYHGCGGSDGRRSELTIEKASRNFLDFLKNLKELGKSDFSSPHIVASSFGATVFVFSFNDIQRFQSIVFKSPAFDLHEAYQNDAMVHNETFESWEKNGVSPGIGLSFEAVRQAKSFDYKKGVSLIRAPTLIIQGDMDEIIPISTTRNVVEKVNVGFHLVELSGVMHNYKQNDAQRKFWDICIGHIEQNS